MDAPRNTGRSGYRNPKAASRIVEYIAEPRDLVAFALVCRTFLYPSIKKIWAKPKLSNRTGFGSFLSTLSSPYHTVPYAPLITAINLDVFPDITDDQFRLLGACENLAHLEMRMCQNISAATLQHTFSQFHRLKAVDLEGVSSITDDVISSLARNNPHLRGVKFGKCGADHWSLTDVGVIALGDYCGSSLREVYFHLPSLSLVTSVALRCLITRCPRLQTLDIAHGTSVDDGVVRLVWQSLGSTLRKLNLAGCSELTNVMLPPPAPSPGEANTRDAASRPLPSIPKTSRHWAPSLREIDLTDCNRLTDYAIDLICTNSPKLRNLNLKGCRRLTDAALHSIAKLGGSVQQLNLAKLCEITDEGVGAISEACRKLASIDLSECTQLTNSCVVSLSRLSRIESLRLNRNENITDFGIMALATPSKNSLLKRVHLSFCKNVTAFSINSLLTTHPQLTFISLSGIPDFLHDPAFLRLSKPVDKGWKPETFRVYATPSSIAQLRGVLSKSVTEPKSIVGTPLSSPGAAQRKPAVSTPESWPLPKPMPAKLEHMQTPVSPAQSKVKSRPTDMIVGASLGTVTRYTAAAPEMKSEKASTEPSKRSHRSRKSQTEKVILTSVIYPDPPPQESPAEAVAKPRSRSPPSQSHPPPVPSYPPRAPPPAAPTQQTQPPQPLSELLETSPIRPGAVNEIPISHQEPVQPTNGALQSPLLLVHKRASVTGPGAGAVLVEGEGGAPVPPPDHTHLSGSISSFEDLEDGVSDYDFLDHKSDLESLAASVELGSGTESGHEDDDDMVDIGEAALRPRCVPSQMGNEGRGNAGNGGVKSELFSDDEDDFECVEIPEL